MIRYSKEQMMEMDRCFRQLRSRSEDVTGYLRQLTSEMMSDDSFLTLFSGEEICEELTQFRFRSQAIHEKINRLADIHKELSEAYEELERRHFKRFHLLSKKLNIMKNQYQRSCRDRKNSTVMFDLEQNEFAYLHKIFTGRFAEINKSSLGGIQFILKEQYGYCEVE